MTPGGRRRRAQRDCRVQLTIEQVQHLLGRVEFAGPGLTLADRIFAQCVVSLLQPAGSRLEQRRWCREARGKDVRWILDRHLFHLSVREGLSAAPRPLVLDVIQQVLR